MWRLLACMTYHQQVLDTLAAHGLVPTSGTSPQQLRDALRELFKYEIRRLRDRLIAGSSRNAITPGWWSRCGADIGSCQSRPSCGLNRDPGSGIRDPIFDIRFH